MSTTVHFIDVGQGNMVLVQCASGTNFVVDCNITEDNKDRVLGYVAGQIGSGSRLHAFICTHRDADHMKGVRTLHNQFPIREVYDSGYPGTSTDTDEYKAYMQLRRDVGHRIIEKQKYNDYGRTRLRYLSAQDDRLPNNANDQGLVIKVEERDANMSRVLGSTILTGDGSSAVWRDGIMKDYPIGDLSCNVLMAAHHGSSDFFDHPDKRYYYAAHIRAMKPALTVISVGKDNSYGHPDPNAVKRYTEHSRGLTNGDKIYRTDRQHTVKMTLPNEGGCSLATNQ